MTNLIIVENILDLVQNPTLKIKDIPNILTNYLRSLNFGLIDIRMDRYLGTDNTEDMFYSNGVFKEDIELLCTVECSDDQCLRKHLFEVNGLKTLVIKSLTRVLEIDSKFASLEGVKNHIRQEWNIPSHGQIYMHGNREITKDELLIDVFNHFSSEEERSKKCLYLNLIILEPKDITVSLKCPYGERIGLPGTITVKETLTIGDLEETLSNMTGCSISLYQQEQGWFSMHKDQRRLFEFSPSFIAHRTIKLRILVECVKCKKPDIIDEQSIISNHETVHEAMARITNQNGTIQCICGFDMPVKMKLSSKNSEIKERTVLLDTPSDYVLIVRAQPTLITRLRGAVGLN
eukprot:TCONS_00009332-protein